jgi:hypothetical protein
MLQQYMPSFLFFFFVDMMHNILLNAASRHHHAVFHLTALLIAERVQSVRGWCIKLKVELCEQSTASILLMICAVFL